MLSLSTNEQVFARESCPVIYRHCSVGLREMVSLLLATESGLWEPRRLLTGQSPYLRHLWPPVARSEKNEQTRVSRARGFRAGTRARVGWVPLGVVSGVPELPVGPFKPFCTPVSVLVWAVAAIPSLSTNE